MQLGTRTKSVVGEVFETSSRGMQQQNVVVHLKSGSEMLKLSFVLVCYRGRGTTTTTIIIIAIVSLLLGG